MSDRLYNEDCLRDLGHTEDEIRFLLKYANHGPRGNPFLTEDEYERGLLALQDLESSSRRKGGC